MPVTNRSSIFFFFNDTATTEIYSLSLHDALPIYSGSRNSPSTRSMTRFTVTASFPRIVTQDERSRPSRSDRKSTRLNSSHDQISYAVFCLKKQQLLGHILLRGIGCFEPCVAILDR